MQAHSRWLHAIRKCVITERKKRGVKNMLRITRLGKYPTDPIAYQGADYNTMLLWFGYQRWLVSPQAD